MNPRKVLITGASGLIGNAIYRTLAGQTGLFDVYGADRQNVVREPATRVPRIEIPPERFFAGDLSGMEFTRRVVNGMDTVIHMAANPSPATPWDGILNSNIIPTYNIFEACREAAVRQVIFASSVRVMIGYCNVEPYRAIMEERLADVPSPTPCVTHEMPVWPVEPYGASKVWGEALARAYSTKHGILCVCLRIGAVSSDDIPHNHRQLFMSVWCSLRDLMQLVGRCLDQGDKLRYDVFYGLSNNRYRWMDIEHARQVVGYTPQDSAEACYVPRSRPPHGSVERSKNA